MSTQGRSTYQATLDTASYFQDNTSELITEAKLRDSLTNLSDSTLFKKDDPFLRIVTATTGTEPAYVITLTNLYSGSYSQLMPILFNAHATNTGAATINVNSLGAKSLKRPDGTATQAGDIVSGQLYIINYNGTDFLIVPGFGGGTAFISSIIIDDNGSGINRLLTNTTDGSDDEAIVLSGGGSNNVTRGAYVSVSGNEKSGSPAVVGIGSGDEGSIQFYTTTGGSQDLAGEVDSNGDWDFQDNDLTTTGTLTASNLPLTATGTITSAQILSSNSSPVELIPAPGAGSFIAIVKTIVSIDYNSATYSLADESITRYSGGDQLEAFGNMVSSTSDAFIVLSSIYGEGNAINEAVQFFSTVSNPTTGDSDIKYKIWYTIETI